MTAEALQTCDFSTGDSVLDAGVRAVRAYFDDGNYIEALESCELLRASRPGSAEALLLLGLISFELDEQRSALVLLTQAHETAPNVREYADALACVNVQIGDATEGLFYAKLATALSPHPLGSALLPEIYSNFFQSFRDARPHRFRDLARRRFDMGDSAGAAELCEKQLEQTPEEPDTWRLLAKAISESGNVERALDACETLGSENLTAEDYDVLARTLGKAGRFDEAETAHKNAIEIEPNDAAFLQSYICTLASRYGDTGDHLKSQKDTWRSQFEHLIEPATQRATVNSDQERPLRVAYVGGEFIAGPIAELLAPILTLHDPNAVQTYCYSSSARYDLASENLAQRCTHWTDIHGVDPITAAEILRGDGIDIAVDLGGYGPDGQLQMFAQRPAPVCVSWLGAALPTNIGFDFFLASELLFSANAEPEGMAETVCRLPATHLAYRPLDAPETVTPLPALSQSHLTLGVMTPLAQIGEACVRDWSEILDMVPTARIVVANVDKLDKTIVQRLHELTNTAGIRDRVDIADLEQIDPKGYGFFDHFDILLDPQPNSRFLETVRALWMAVPVLATTGIGYHGRLAASALSAAGLQDWAFSTNQARGAAIAALNDDREKLANIRAELRDIVSVSPLCDVAAFARDLENAYRAMAGR